MQTKPLTPIAGAGLNPAGLPLTRLDLMRYEPRLRAVLAEFVSFKAHSLHFPVQQDGAEAQPEYIRAERRLLLPLYEEGPTGRALLGLFVARGVPPKGIKTLLPMLPAIAGLCLQNLRLFKAAQLDALSGLFTRYHLLDAMTETLELARASLYPQDLPEAAAVPGGHVGFALLLIRLTNLAQVARAEGYLTADRLLARLAATLVEHKPEGALAARSGDYELALLLPSAGAAACKEAAIALTPALRKAEIRAELTGVRLRAVPALGYAVCPRDLDDLAALPAPEQARMLLRKARLAASVASEEQRPGQAAVMGFGRILAEGGRILELLPLSRLRISLGKAMGAREGQRFAIWGRAARTGDKPSSLANHYKGELLLVEIKENEALAELIHADDPQTPPALGDRLILLEGEPAHTPQGTGQAGGLVIGKTDGLLPYAAFLPLWCAEREKHENFALLLARFAAPPADFTQERPEDNRYWNELLTQAVAIIREALGSVALSGRYALNSLIFYLPLSAPDQTAALPAQKCRELTPVLQERLGLSAAFGLAPHPFLHFRKLDALENARKALDYALLLPHPHVGVLDSLALNISADRLFSLGDSLGALTEYKEALLCDEGNILARNSLAVCLAGLGRHAEARRHFAEAFSRDKNNLMTLYNFGHLCQALGEHDEARRLYLRCLKLEPGSIYALVRLGQLAEKAGKWRRARELYLKAAALPGGAALTRRNLARLALHAGKPEEARELLHEALAANPQDALALQLLAGLYLDAGEDPQVAASLARQSAALRPDLKGAWLGLARALEADRKPLEARAALLKAGAL